MAAACAIDGIMGMGYEGVQGFGNIITGYGLAPAPGGGGAGAEVHWQLEAAPACAT